MLSFPMNSAFHPQAAPISTCRTSPPSSKLGNIRNFCLLIVNQQIPNEHLHNCIKTNSFNSFTINTYENPREGGCYG
jgi:hypothetical protein